jgi:hypothetical protein
VGVWWRGVAILADLLMSTGRSKGGSGNSIEGMVCGLWSVVGTCSKEKDCGVLHTEV